MDIRYFYTRYKVFPVSKSFYIVRRFRLMHIRLLLYAIYEMFKVSKSFLSREYIQFISPLFHNSQCD